MAEDIRDQVEQVLEKIRPAVMMDGGNIELVDVIEGVVTVRLLGACHGCPSSTATLQFGQKGSWLRGHERPYSDECV